MIEKRRAQTGGGEVEKVDMPGKFNFYPKRPECPVWFFKEDVCFICSVYYGGRKAKKRSDKIEVFYNLFILVLTFIRSVTSQWTLILLSIRNTSHSIMLDSCHFDSDIETLSSVTSFRYILLSDIYFHNIKYSWAWSRVSEPAIFCMAPAATPVPEIGFQACSTTPLTPILTLIIGSTSSFIDFLKKIAQALAS